MKKCLLVLLMALPVPVLCQTIDEATNQQEQTRPEIVHGVNTLDEGEPETAQGYFRRRRQEIDETSRQAKLIASQSAIETRPERPALPTAAIEPNLRTLAQNVMEERAGLGVPVVVEPHDAEVPLTAKIVALALFAFILAGIIIVWRTRTTIMRAVAGAVVIVGAGTIIVARKTIATGARLRAAMIARADAHGEGD